MSAALLSKEEAQGRRQQQYRADERVEDNWWESVIIEKGVVDEDLSRRGGSCIGSGPGRGGRDATRSVEVFEE